MADPDLFAALDDAKRQRLRERGWQKVFRFGADEPHWRRPDGAIFTEEESFRQLEALEKKEKEAH